MPGKLEEKPDSHQDPPHSFYRATTPLLPQGAPSSEFWDASSCGNRVSARCAQSEVSRKTQQCLIWPGAGRLLVGQSCRTARDMGLPRTPAEVHTAGASSGQPPAGPQMVEEKSDALREKGVGCRSCPNTDSHRAGRSQDENLDFRGLAEDRREQPLL